VREPKNADTIEMLDPNRLPIIEVDEAIALGRRSRHMSFHWMLVMILVASPASAGKKSDSQVGTRAPAIASPYWINTDPIESKDLEGKIVLVEFWTFGSVPCMATVSAMHKLRKLLRSSEVAIVSVHTPESDREKESRHLEDAVRSLGIDYPVAVDNDRVIWRNFRARHWPTLYVVDQHGIIRYVHRNDLREHTARWDSLLEMIRDLRKQTVPGLPGSR
jgi:alkyl hydroperoxide reductase subunit AhpC